MTDFFICVSTNIFRVYLISRFMKVFFDEDKRKNNGENLYNHILSLYDLVYVCFFLVNTTLYLFFHSAPVNFLCNIIGIGLIVLTYTRSLKMIFFVTSSVYFIHMCCDTVSTFLFVNYRDGDSFNQVFEVITVFLILICELLTEKIIDTKRNKENVRNLSLILVPLCSIWMFCVLIYTKNVTKGGIVIISIGLMLINFFIYYLYNMLSTMFYFEFENQMLRQRVQNYAAQMEIMVQSEEKVKALRHDMKHHLNELRILASQNRIKEIATYIDDMDEFIVCHDEIVSSGNAEIDSVMNYMLRRAKQELYHVNVNVQLPKAVSHIFDINVIMGNLLENAIEAAAQTNEKRLDFRVELTQGFLRIQIENSYSGKTKQEHGRFFTTKSDKDMHGIGLKNVRNIVNKYNGKMDVRQEENRFCVVLILYISDIPYECH